MPTTFALLRDPVAITFLFACFLALVACAVRLWVKASRQIELERHRPERVDPVDFDGEIRAFKTARDERLMGERRAA